MRSTGAMEVKANSMQPGTALIRDRPPPRSIRLGRDLAGLAVVAERDIGEGALGHFDALAAPVPARPALDVDGDGAATDPADGAVAADLVADEDRQVKGHAGGGGGRDPPARPLHREAAAGPVHLRAHP